MKNDSERLMDEYLARGGRINVVPSGRRAVRRSVMKSIMRGDDICPGRSFHWKAGQEPSAS